MNIGTIESKSCCIEDQFQAWKISMHIRKFDGSNSNFTNVGKFLWPKIGRGQNLIVSKNIKVFCILKKHKLSRNAMESNQNSQSRNICLIT